MSKIQNIIISDIIALIEENKELPWEKPWGAGAAAPQNMVWKKPYRGINRFMCALTASVRGFTSPYWLTFGQIRKMEGSVKKGEKATKIVKWGSIEIKDKQTGEVKDKIWRPMKYFKVFNLDQTEGIEAPPSEEKPLQWNPIEECDRVIDGYEGCPTIGVGTKACYVPSMDIVKMLNSSLFKTMEHYYATLFHELAHSTGSADRLNRKGVTDPIRFGSHQYSKEELIAEFTAALLCARTGIEKETRKNPAAYVAGWCKYLKEKGKEIFSAASQAEKAYNYILQQEQEVGETNK
jgi:antirestriction protein ArdC